MSTKIKLFFIILLGVICLLCACDTRDPFFYCTAPFTVEAEGVVDGVSLQAKIYCDPTVHSTKEIYTQMNVTYLSPESLRGITVTFTSDQKSYARLNDMEMSLQNAGGMTEIFRLICPTSPPTSLKYDKEKLEVEFTSDQGSYTVYFDKIGDFPSKIKGTLGERKFDVNLSEYISSKAQD